MGVALAAPVYIANVTVDHVPRNMAFDFRSAPREMELWAMVEGDDNMKKVQKWRETKEASGKPIASSSGDAIHDKLVALPNHHSQYLRIATFTYDPHASHNIQTFPVDKEIASLEVDFGIVILRIKNNWGRQEFTCLYRFRVHGQMRVPP